MVPRRRTGEVGYSAAMAKLMFTPNLARLIQCPEGEWPGTTVREVLLAAFAHQPQARSYVLDDQGELRKHVTVFVDGEQVMDRTSLGDPVGPGAQIYVMQALSGG
jgi:molybdopterin synthase sulfur carrier subunit